jgi:hypothetical protein
MKRLMLLVLAVLFCLPLCACKSDAVRAVQRMIDRIGTVTIGSEARIQKAEEFYAELSEQEKRRVSNYDVLLEARRTYDSLFETVELTRDNWDEYFEIIEEVRWVIGSDGTVYSGFIYDIVFKIREEHAADFLRWKSEFAAELSVGSGLKHCIYDRRTGEAHFEPVEPENLPEHMDVLIKPAQVVTVRQSNILDRYSPDAPVYWRIEGEGYPEKNVVLCLDGTAAFLVNIVELLDIEGKLVLVK